MNTYCYKWMKLKHICFVYERKEIKRGKRERERVIYRERDIKEREREIEREKEIERER